MNISEIIDRLVYLQIQMNKLQEEYVQLKAKIPDNPLETTINIRSTDEIKPIIKRTYKKRDRRRSKKFREAVSQRQTAQWAALSPEERKRRSAIMLAKRAEHKKLFQ